MHRFFTENTDPADPKIRITGNDVNHMKNVLRLKAGDPVEVSDGQRLYRCEIDSYEAHEAVLRVTEVLTEDRELPSKIVLFQGLPKSDKMELIIQKAVELGVSEIVPFSAARSVVSLTAEKAKKKRERYQMIAESAAKQSGRTYVPAVSDVMTFEKAVSYAETLDRFLFPYECETDRDRTGEVLEKIRPGESVGIMIGPEGGFEKAEVERAEEAGALTITLGKRILRTETAGLAALSILLYLLEIRRNGQ